MESVLLIAAFLLLCVLAGPSTSKSRGGNGRGGNERGGWESERLRRKYKWK